MQQKQIHIREAFRNLPNETYVCYWHKLDIIMYYCDWHFPLNRIQDFVYSFDAKGQKCQIENCPCDAEIKLIKHNTINGKPIIKELLEFVR